MKNTLAAGVVLGGTAIALTAYSANIVFDLFNPPNEIHRAENPKVRFRAIPTGPGDQVRAVMGIYATTGFWFSLPPGDENWGIRVRDFPLTGTETEQRLDLRAGYETTAADTERTRFGRLNMNVNVLKVKFWNTTGGGETTDHSSEEFKEYSDARFSDESDNPLFSIASEQFMDEIVLNSCPNNDIRQFRGIYGGTATVLTSESSPESCVNIYTEPGNPSADTCFGNSGEEYRAVFEDFVEEKGSESSVNDGYFHVFLVESIDRGAGPTAGVYPTLGSGRRWTLVSETSGNDERRPGTILHEWGHGVGYNHSGGNWIDIDGSVGGNCPGGNGENGDNLMCGPSGATLEESQCDVFHEDANYDEYN